MAFEIDDAPPVIRRWLELAKARDAAALDNLLADDVVFESPVVFAPQRGKAIAKAYLTAALDVLANETFRYVGFWRAESSAVLEFMATIEGVEIDGVDMIGWSEEGRIVSFKVMARPWKGLETLRSLMAARLEAMRKGAG